MIRHGEFPGKVQLASVRQIRTTPLSQHLREFATRPGAWVVLARNMIPVVGIYGFGWSAALTVFNYWFDGLTALAAIIAALIPRALRETQSKKDHATWAGNIVRGVVTWIFLVGIVGLPYWIVLIPLHDLLLGDQLRRELMQSPALWLTFGSLAASHFWKAFRIGYDTMPDKDLKQRARWDIYLLLLRAIAMFIMAAHGLAFILVPLMSLLLSYLEIWPGRALGAVFGDPSRLWEYDPGDRYRICQPDSYSGHYHPRSRRLYFPVPAKAGLENFDLSRLCYSLRQPSSLPTWLSSPPKVARDVPGRDSAFFSLS